jgi:hypothetical protein
MMRVLIFLLILPISLFAQRIEFERSDSIHIGNSVFSTYVLKINNYSASDPAMVFVAPLKTFDSLKRQISKFYFSRKQEYNEYYLLGVADLIQPAMVNQALTEFLNQVDTLRIKRNRTTFLRQYSWDNVNKKIVYKSTFKDLTQVDNLHYLKSAKDICKYMICPY